MKTDDYKVPARVIMTGRHDRWILIGERWAWPLVVGRELPSRCDRVSEAILELCSFREIITIRLMDLDI